MIMNSLILKKEKTIEDNIIKDVKNLFRINGNTMKNIRNLFRLK